MQILRRKAVCQKLGGIDEGTLWRLTRDDLTFPAAIKINKRVLGWLDHEITQWIEAASRATKLVGALPMAGK
jgi:prophage regulatory protein